MRKSLPLVLLFLLLTTSCGAQTSGENAAPTLTAIQPPATSQVLPATEPPTATPSPTVQPSPTSTPETPVPTNSPGCINSAAFVADVTVADNEIIPSSTDFTKIWRIKNTGTCTWGPDYTLTHYAGERMLSPSSVPLSVTYPGQTVDLSMNLTAPNTDGKHAAYFVIKNPAGLIMKIDKDSRLWVLINVSSQLVAITQSAESIPVTGNGIGLSTADCAYTTDGAKVTEAINAINAYRAENGLPAYAVNDLLTQSAAAHASDMACNKLFAHNGSDDSTPTTRVAASGYSASSVIENVYGSYPPLTGQGAVDWWRNDKTDVRHNQNLLSTTYTEIGVAYSFFNNFGYYVLVFAKPK